MLRPFLALSALLFCLGLFGCAGTVERPSGGIVVAFPNAFSLIHVGDPPVTLTPQVANDPNNSGVIWELSLAATNCSPGCGTLTPSVTDPRFTAVYTPPAVVPLNTTATITATARADNRAVFVFNFTITQKISVTINNKFKTLLSGSSPVPLTATVANDPANAGVTWSLTVGSSSSSCAPVCGTLTPNPAPSFGATYTPPPTAPTDANASPTITATSVTKTSASDSFSFTITSPNAFFKGNYAFLVRGYDILGNPMAMAGSITADGNGNITRGNLDNNDGTGITFVPQILGSYSIDTSFFNIVHGTFTITNFTFPGSPKNISFKFFLSSDRTRGKILELDGLGFLINVGTIQLQDPSWLAAANPSGTYVFGLDSDSPLQGRTVEVGEFVLTPSGVHGGLADESKAGDPLPRYSAAPIVAGTATTPDSSGRGTLTLNVNPSANPGNTSAGSASSTQYAYYMVNSDRLYLIEIDHGVTFGTVQAGVARKQKSLSTTSTNSTVVLQMTGMDTIPGTSTGIGSDVIIGVIRISSGNAFDLTFDANDLGGNFPGDNIVQGHTGTGTLTFDPATGRGVISVPGGFQSGFVDSAVFYLNDTGQGFIIDADPSTCVAVVCTVPPPNPTTNNAFSGTLTPQAPGPFQQNILSGSMLFSSGASAVPNIPSAIAALTMGNGTNSYAAVVDWTSQDLLGYHAHTDDLLNGGNYAIKDANIGRGTLDLPEAVFGNVAPSANSFYIIGPNQFVAIGVVPGINNNGTDVKFIDPE